MARFFGGLLCAIGALFMVASSLWAAFALMIVDASKFAVLILSGQFFLLGLGLFVWGQYPIWPKT